MAKQQAGLQFVSISELSFDFNKIVLINQENEFFLRLIFFVSKQDEKRQIIFKSSLLTLIY